MKASILKARTLCAYSYLKIKLMMCKDVYLEHYRKRKRKVFLCNSLSFIYNLDMEFPWFLVWCHPMTCVGSKTCTRDSDRVSKLMKDHSVTN